MTSIFGYPTIEAEVVSLINQGNAAQAANFAVGDLALTLGDYDSLEGRQRFSIKDTTGKYFGTIANMGLFKRNFQTLFKGIPILLQVESGLTNRQLLAILCTRYGLPPFSDSDFAPGLLDMTIPVTDDTVPVTWPFSLTSLGWSGSVQFSLRNSKTALSSIITDGIIPGLTPTPITGMLWQIKTPALNGLTYPVWNDLNQIITETRLDGLEYPGDTELSTVITQTYLNGLEYSIGTNLPDLDSELHGLEYLPAQDLSELTAALSGLDYPLGLVENLPSAWVLTRGLDFSDYSYALGTYHRNDALTDPTLVNVIVGKIAQQWPGLNNEASLAALTMSFTGAIVNRILVYQVGDTLTVRVIITLASQNAITGNAVLQYTTSMN